jgi:undecaprenyl-phosphate 4-deoxy-4-formamido-L-arabinose transferase
VVVPVYNGAKTLDLLTERLQTVLPAVAESFELILVNDDSPDESWAVIERLAKTYPWVRGVALMRNAGQHNATLCGIRAARYEVIVTLDDDLQNPPEDIPALLAKLDEGWEVVYGVPRKRAQAWWKGLLAAWVKRSISYVMGMRTVRDIGAFRAFRTHLRQAFDHYEGPDVLVDVLLSWGTQRFASVEVDEAPRQAGASNYNLWALAKVALLMLTSYTTLPLRLASLIGFVFTLFGFFVLIYVLVIYFTVQSIPGFPFLASTISIFSGVQLFALGIIGEYLARIFERTGGRRAYTVSETTDRLSTLSENHKP